MRHHDVVEVRVHGVSGTPPEDLLDRPNVVRLDGDARAGFYRSANPADITDRYVSRPGSRTGDLDGPYLEGYAWGGLTSGSAWRSLWLLLLPFSLLNVAPRLRPADPRDPGRAHRARLRLVWLIGRWLALCSTAVFVMAFIGVGMDLGGYQCGQLPTCTAGPHWVDRLAFGHTPAHQLLVGAVVPLAVLALLWFIGGRTIARYESVGVLDTLAEPRDTGPEPPGIKSRWMWQNERPVRRMRAAHLQTGVAMVVAFAAGPLDGWQHVFGLVVGVGVIAFAVVAVAIRGFTAPYPARGWSIASVVCWLALLAAGTADGLCLGRGSPGLRQPEYSALDPHEGQISFRVPGLPGYAATALWLLIAELALLLVLLVVIWGAARAAAPARGFGVDGPSPGMAGYGTWVLSVMAVFMGAVFTAGVYLFVGGWLRTHHTIPRPTDITTLTPYFTYPEVIVDAGFAYAIAVAFAVGVIVACLAYALVQLARVRDTSGLIVPNSGATDYGDAWTSGDPVRRKAILKAMWLGRIVDLAGRPLLLLMIAGAALSEVVGVLLVLEHTFGVTAAEHLHGGRGLGFFSIRNMEAIGAYAVVLTLVGLVALGYYAFRQHSLRRSVGILWDLASFWPRLCHPLAAPCYAERAVPDLVERVHLHANAGYGVVLTAHSQGTVLSAATMLQLQRHDELSPPSQPKVVPNTALLTCGCVLRRLYGRYFPAYFGPATLDAVATMLTSCDTDADTDTSPTRWRNLWRYTDYLGGPVTAGPPPVAQQPWSATPPTDPGSAPVAGLHIDSHLIDPAFDPLPGTTDVPAPRRHSDFWKEPEFQRAVLFLASTIPVRRGR